jgi:hypothetical protein
MQLGTRWSVGGEPPARIPDEMRSAIADVETQLARHDTRQWRWTLTWLESRPVAELDDGTIVRLSHGGMVEVVNPVED